MAHPNKLMRYPVNAVNVVNGYPKSKYLDTDLQTHCKIC